MKIILDFDDTIFNTGAYVDEKINVFKQAGFTRDNYFVIYEKVLKEKGYFDADLIIDLFFKIKKFDKEKAKSEIESIINNTKVFVYKDFFDFVKSFNKKDLTLVSVGTGENHKRKIENAGIVSFFDKVSIPEKYKSGEIELIVKKYPTEKIFFIDDKASQIDEVKKRLPQIIAIKMERPTGRYVLPKSKFADRIVKNLDEAKKIINELNK